MKLPSLEEQYRGKTVLITGHTGFKGAWLSLMLSHLGANVVGYALPPPSTPNLFAMTGLAEDTTHIEGDIRDYARLRTAIAVHQPDILFHLAAQAIVLNGYSHPKETFDVNAGGTVNVLEALRETNATKACVIITTDKCYENNHWPWGYRENDSLGGTDPYSSSKSMAEIATAAYRSSFFSNDYKSSLLVASARAGNIIGGGDFSAFRIVPDCMRALTEGRSIEVRNPYSARPWLYVLDALTGYLQLGNYLLQGDEGKAEAWNFGPQENRAISVKELVDKAISLWGEGHWKDLSESPKPHEMPFLRLNWDKAAHGLKWKPLYNWQRALEASIDWYRSHQQGQAMRAFCHAQINTYMQDSHHEVYSCTP